jgi:hypothetical protein
MPRVLPLTKICTGVPVGTIDTEHFRPSYGAYALLKPVQTASILALDVNCSFWLPIFDICRNASTPYPSRLCNSRPPAQYSAYTRLIGRPMPSLRSGGLDARVLREESLGFPPGESVACRTSFMVAARVGTSRKFCSREALLGPLLKDQRNGVISRGIPPP